LTVCILYCIEKYRHIRHFPRYCTGGCQIQEKYEEEADIKVKYERTKEKGKKSA
jgi:hypothetical protein